MITTVTTTVVMLQQMMVAAVFGVIVLIASLVAKEFLGSTPEKTRASSLACRLKIVILPLFFTFTVALAIKIWEVI